jgi:diguanylate cyclase (GGDEF)-like protein
VDLRRGKKSKARESQKAAHASDPTSSAAIHGSGGTASEAEAAVEDRGASAATTVERHDTADADADAAERSKIAEVMYKAGAERAEIAEAMYRAALTRGALAEAREKAAAEHAAAVEVREKALAERDSIANSRDRTAAERDSIANSRDRTATARDSIANPRDRTAAARDSIANSRLAAGRDGAAEDVDDAALELARLEAELQRAHLDGLTGAFRREMGRLALRNEIERARRADGKFVIAFIDVDGLKGVNDRDGHAAGDRVLRMLAATMRANLRTYDPIVRFGGDEFICGISSIDPSEAQHRIGVIDQSLRTATGVGITAGLASLMSNESLDDLTARADAALVEAKRNRGE